MIDYAFLENCMKNAASLSDEDRAKCKRMLQAFISHNDWVRLRKIASNLTNQAGVLAVYSFCKIINADDSVLFNVLFSYWLSGDGRSDKFSPHSEIKPAYEDFFHFCNDIILLQKAFDRIGINNSDYGAWLNLIKRQIKLLEENEIRISAQQQITKPN